METLRQEDFPTRASGPLSSQSRAVSSASLSSEEHLESPISSVRYLFAFAGWPPGTRLDRAERLALLLEANGYPLHAHLLKGRLLFQSGQYRQAVLEINAMTQFNSLLEEREDLRLEAAALIAKCLVFLGEHREAEKIFLHVLNTWHPDMDPQRGLIDAHRGLFSIYYDQGALTHAIGHMEEVARLDPSDGRAPRTLGFIYKNILQSEDLAIEFLTEALHRNLTPLVGDEVRAELAEIFVRKGQVDQALQMLENITDYPRVLALRAECLRIQGQTATAEELLKRALASDPGNLDALRLLADLHLEAHRSAEAVILLKRALQADPNDDRSLSLLVRAHEMAGARAEAEQVRQTLRETQALFEEMSQLTREALTNPWDPVVRYRLAETCRKLHKPDLAAIWTQAAKACAGREPSEAARVEQQ